jgi:hypothetical protein
MYFPGSKKPRWKTSFNFGFLSVFVSLTAVGLCHFACQVVVVVIPPREIFRDHGKKDKYPLQSYQCLETKRCHAT